MKNVSGTFKTMDEVYRYYMIGLINTIRPEDFRRFANGEFGFI